MWQLWHPSRWVQNGHPVAQHAYQDALTQRPAQSRDDIDISRPQRSGERDEEQRVRREMEHLRMQLKEANTRAKQAERAAEELAQQLKSRSSEMTVDTPNSTDTTATLKAENKGLKAELDEARSHIFSLQPYRKDLTPKEVGQVSCDAWWLRKRASNFAGQDFDDLVNGITDWVTNFMDPILDDDDRIDDVLAAAKERPGDVQKLKRYIRSQGDLVHGCMFPETDIDIMIAVVMRFLQDHIFQKILFGAAADAVEAITFVEASMQTNVEPKRGMYICQHSLQRRR